MAIVNAVSTSQSDVQDAVDLAGYGDTVIVPSGASTWSSVLEITKNILFFGAGIGNTVITSSIGDDSDELVRYTPDSTSRSTNGFFRITGFTFNGNSHGSRGVHISNYGSQVLISNIRVDHNRFVECKFQGIRIYGFVHGLVDNNQFHNCYKNVDVYGEDWYSWEDIPLELGTANSLYIEDNEITFDGSITCSGITTGGLGGRYVFRHNTVDNQEDFDVMDMHGNQDPVTAPYSPNGSRACVSAEIYENIITNYRVGSSGGRFLNMRGGTAIVFNNSVPSGPISSVVIDYREEDGSQRFNYLDDPPGYDTIINSYIWNNTYEGAEIFPTALEEEDERWIIQDENYWQYESSFDGTTGIGVGLLSARPSSTTNGVGYWATDTLKLYRVENESWEVYYVPYTYPHPMQGSVNYSTIYIAFTN